MSVASCVARSISSEIAESQSREIEKFDLPSSRTLNPHMEDVASKLEEGYYSSGGVDATVDIRGLLAIIHDLQEDKREFFRMLTVPQVSTPSSPVREEPSNSCNLHEDCAFADARNREKNPGSRGASHCNDDDCEDCFGR